MGEGFTGGKKKARKSGVWKGCLYGCKRPPFRSLEFLCNHFTTRNTQTEFFSDTDFSWNVEKLRLFANTILKQVLLDQWTYPK